MKDKHYHLSELFTYTNICFMVDKGYFRSQMMQCKDKDGKEHIIYVVGASRNVCVDEPTNEYNKPNNEEIDWLFSLEINDSKMARVLANMFNKCADRMELKEVIRKKAKKNG